MTDTNLTDLLRGCEVIKDKNDNAIVQTIRNMEIVFLTTDDTFSFDNRFANPLDVVVSNHTYGHVAMQNASPDRDMIVAPQVAVFANSAQNHAMVKSAAIKAASQNNYNDAGCIQGTNTGYIRGQNVTAIRFMPVGLRESLLRKIGSTEGYSHLYKHITAFGSRTESGSGNYLDKYYSHFSGDLAEFIAHFERPEKVIGFIVLVDGEVLAIDKFPSFTYARQVWELLVRDCYSSVAIESMVKNKTRKTQDFTKLAQTTAKEDDETTAQYLSRVLTQTKQNISDRVRERVRELTTVAFDMEKDKDNSDDVFESNILKSNGYIGQSIASGGFYHLVSIIKKEAFDPDNIRETLQVTEEYRQASENQRSFII